MSQSKHKIKMYEEGGVGKDLSCFGHEKIAQQPKIVAEQPKQSHSTAFCSNYALFGEKRSSSIWEMPTFVQCIILKANYTTI
jgi:hypothetical protein